MTDDPHDELDEVLLRAARGYNAPSEVPREAMWQRIQARRDEARSARDVLPLRSAHRRGEWIRRVAAVAALLLLGVAIGRGYERLAGRHTAALVATRVSDSSSTAFPGRPLATLDSARDLATTTGSVTVPPVAAAPSPSGRHTLRDTLPSVAQRSATPDSTLAAAASTAGSTNMTYRLAVLEHLAGTEAMLMSFRAAAKRGDVDPQITTWARKLLTTTRLLESSPAQQDPTMKRLLGDLELVLLQIAQYAATGSHRAEELELIEHSIERRGVIGKLRTSIPARLTPAGT